MVNEMFLPRENVRNYLQFLQRLLKSCKSNLSANDIMAALKWMRSLTYPTLQMEIMQHHLLIMWEASR